MVADSLRELHEFAESIGLNKCYFHKARIHPHYDVVNKNLIPLKDKNGIKFIDKALQNGAIIIGKKELLLISKKLILHNE